MKIACIIPARYASQRLPGKPMRVIIDTPMIGWVYKRASGADLFDQVIVATDDQRIFDYIRSIGGEARMTPTDLSSGTDRVAYVAKDLQADVVVNIQGDEPLITPEILIKVCEPFMDPAVHMSTPVTIIKSEEDMTDPNLVRVVIDKQSNAIYFSRAVIPFCRDHQKGKDWLKNHTYYQHIGIYAYRNSFLQKLTSLPQGSLEKTEKLEQLRVLENGYKIRTVITDYHPYCVDTEEDLNKVTKYITDHHINLDNSDAKV